MKRFSSILLYVTIALLLLWQLPWCYNFFAVKPDKGGFTLYSGVIGDFAMIGQKAGEGIVRYDASGHEYTQAQFDSILPLFYYRQLITDERFPDTLNGVAVTPRMAQLSNIVFRSVPSDINAPHIGLYPLLESMSGRVDLEMPGDVFRITHKEIEFIDMESNSVKEKKSKLFTEMLLKKGFHFPAVEIAGNPTTRKDYDEGYVILDAEHHLFHLKQVKGRPYVRAVQLPQSLLLKHLFITEFRNRKTLALMTDVDNQLYVLTPAYEVIKVGIPSFNPETDYMTILGNMFDWTVRITTAQAENYYAVDANDYSLIRSLKREFDNKYIPGLSFTSYKDKYVMPRFE